jgi:hypothetical protein
MLAEPPMYVTKVTRCKVCDLSFPSAHQLDAQSSESPAEVFIEMCPAAHKSEYETSDYYFV